MNRTEPGDTHLRLCAEGRIDIVKNVDMHIVKHDTVRIACCRAIIEDIAKDDASFR